VRTRPPVPLAHAMTFATGLRCTRCGTRYPLLFYDRDCGQCHDVAPSALAVEYDPSMLVTRPAKPCGAGLWRFGDLLPIDRSDAISLGEGGTPLLPLARIAARLGLTHLWAKDETREPTGSFKDRLACVGVSAARERRARVIVSSSSGNAGAAAAAYAARAGLACIVFTFQGASGPLVTQMRALGAMVLSMERSDDRLLLLKLGMRRFGWFSTSPCTQPVVGSNPLALEGYKTLAYEIAEAMDWAVPDWCVLPVCYGDALAAIRRGFTDMVSLGWTNRVPRLVAAEVAGSLGAALASGDDAPPDVRLNAPTIATSIGASRGTFQALDALRRTDGLAVKTRDDQILHWQAALASEEGIWLEPAAAAGLAAVAQLVESQIIKANDSIVIVATAGGLKDSSRWEAQMDPVPIVPPDLEAALTTLRYSYGFDATAEVV
jgi:threonine synthase